MKAVGEVYLSRHKPHTHTGTDGVFELSLQAIDRQGAHQRQPWRLIWRGPEAKTFWDVHRCHLLPGAALEVTAHKMRQDPITGRDVIAEIKANVQSLHLPAIAANPALHTHRHQHAHQGAAAAC